LLAGSADSYPTDQTTLIAAGNEWRPRPVFQSYAAYNENLAARNRDHLVGGSAAENILFRIAPIDARLPSLEDGASWPALLSYYEPTSLSGAFLVLHRRAKPRDTRAELIGSGWHELGESVAVPDADSLLFAEILLEPSVTGRLAGAVLRSGRLRITLDLVNGRRETYRLISSMSRTGVLISPLVQDSRDFAMLYGGTTYLEPRKVRSMTIDPEDHATWWRRSYRVTWKRMDPPAGFDAYRFLPIDAPLGGEHELARAAHCEGSVDEIAGSAPTPSPTVHDIMTISGWMARSIQDVTSHENERVVVALTRDGDRPVLYPTRPVSRPDVSSHFGHPELAASGFTATLDVSRLKGRYSLALALRDGDRMELCPQFRYTVRMTSRKDAGVGSAPDRREP
jgi:hypothetical protein